MADSGDLQWTDADIADIISEAKAEARLIVKAQLRDEFVSSLLALARADSHASTAGATTTAERRAGPIDHDASSSPSAQADVASTGRSAASPPPDDAAGCMPAVTASPSDRDLLYVYGIIQAGTHLPADEPDLLTVASGPLAAVAQRVPAVSFGTDALARNLEDLGWLSATSTRHDGVLQRLLPATLVPLRLCSIFSTTERVRRMLDEQRDEFMAALDRVRGCDELGARIVVDRALVRQAAGRTTPPETPSGSGTAYLAERQRQRGADDDARRLATIIGDEAHAVFAELATDARRRPPQDPRLSGESAWMILNGAYLVPRDRHEAFHRLADDIQDRCAAAGTVVTLTGPWAPYNFVAQSEHAS